VVFFYYTSITSYKHYIWHLTVCYIIPQRVAFDKYLERVEIRSRRGNIAQNFWWIDWFFGQRCPETHC